MFKLGFLCTTLSLRKERLNETFLIFSFTVRKEVNLITTEPESVSRKDPTSTLFLLERGKAAAANLIHLLILTLL